MAQRIRDWQPEAITGGFTTTRIGFNTTQVSQSFNAGTINQNLKVNMSQIGFMTTREALSILPPEQLTNSKNMKKRKAGVASSAPSESKVRQSKQTSLKSWFAGEPQVEQKAPLVRVQSSGIIQDRGRVSCKAQLPALLPDTLPPSSPESVYDPDLLPAVSFSSPHVDPPRADETVGLQDDVPISPLGPKSVLPSVPSVGNKVQRITQPTGNGDVASQRRSLGIRRGMKPWSAKS